MRLPFFQRCSSIALGLSAGLLITLSSGLCRAQAAGQANAQPSAQPGNQAIAEALFQDGRRLMDAGNLTEGCPKLEQSHKADPQIGTLLNVAVCHEQQGRSATAWAEFLDAEAQATRANQADRAAFAHEGVTRLEGKLSKLTLRSLAVNENMVIVFDGKPFAPSMLGTSLPVDPGEHTLEVTAPGKKTLKAALTIAAGPIAQTLNIPLLADEAPPPAAPAPVAAAPAPASRESSPRAESGGVPAWAWVGLGVGAAGILTGSVTGAMAMSRASKLQNACPNKVCPDDQGSKLNTALTLADISTVSYIVGALGSAVGLTGILTAPGHTENSAGVFLKVDIGRVDVSGRF